MTALVPIEPGQWVLAWSQSCFFSSEDSMVEMIERLRLRGAGWDYMGASCIFEVYLVTRVMPKTYGRRGKFGDHREYREMVIVSASSKAEIIAIRDKLFAIGHAADDAIERKALELVADFARETRTAALAKVHAALPHIFGARS